MQLAAESLTFYSCLALCNEVFPYLKCMLACTVGRRSWGPCSNQTRAKKFTRSIVYSLCSQCPRRPNISYTVTQD